MHVLSGCNSSPTSANRIPYEVRLPWAFAVHHRVVTIPLERHRRELGCHPSVKRVVHEKISQQWGEDSSNAMGNFCFEVSLSYRRLERLPRVTGSE